MKKPRLKATKGKKNKQKANYLYVKTLTQSGIAECDVSAVEVDWFDINNYNIIDDMTISELHSELQEREQFFDLYFLRAIDTMENTTFKRAYKSILDGRPKIGGCFSVVSDGEYAPSKENGWFGNIGEPVIRQLTVQDIRTCHDWLEERNAYHKYISPPDSQQKIMSLDPLAKHQFPKREKLYFSADLVSATDDELVHAFKIALAECRTQYNVHSYRANQIAPLTAKKVSYIYENKILPLADLLIWQLKNQRFITISQIGKLLEGCQVDDPNQKAEYQASNFMRTVFQAFDFIYLEGGLSRLAISTRNNKTLCNAKVGRVREVPDAY